MKEWNNKIIKSIRRNAATLFVVFKNYKKIEQILVACIGSFGHKLSKQCGSSWLIIV